MISLSECVKAIVFVTSLLRGGHGAPSTVGIVCGSPVYWILAVMVIPSLSLIAWYMLQYACFCICGSTRVSKIGIVDGAFDY